MRLLCATLAALLPCVAIPAELYGEIVDAGGRPVPGATVWLYWIDGGRRWDPQPPELVGTAVTAPDGSLAVEDEKHDPSERGPWLLCAHKDGYGLAGLQYLEGRYRLKLRPSTRLRRMVVGADGEPLAGALVTLLRARYVRLPGVYLGFAVPPAVAEACGGVARTDERGVFEVEVLPAGWKGTFRLTAPGYDAEFQALADDDRSPVRVQRAGSLRGRIVCPEEAGRAGGFVLHAHSVWAREADAYRPRVRADPEGRFYFPVLPPGPCELRVLKQAWQLHHVSPQTTVAIWTGEEATVELVAEPTVPVRGRVVDAMSRVGVEGAEISARAPSGMSWVANVVGETDADGRFEVRVGPWTNWLTARRPGYSGRGTVRPAIDSRAAFVDLGEIALGPLYDFEVRFVDEQGQRVPGVTTEVYDMAWGYYPRPSGKADEDGVYRYKRPARPADEGGEQRRFSVVAQAHGLAQDPDFGIQLGPRDASVKVVLKRGMLASMTAALTDQYGRPITDADVDLRIGDAGLDWAAREPPGADGRLHITGIRPKRSTRVRISAPDCDIYVAERWVPEPGEALDLGTIAFHRHAATLAGVVENEAGAPVAGVTVYNTGDAPSKLVCQTDDAGRFRLEGLREGYACAFVDAHGYRFAGVRAKTGADGVRIVLKRDGPGTVGERPGPRQWPMTVEDGRRMAIALLTETLQKCIGAEQRVRAGLLRQLAALDMDAAYLAAAEGGDGWDLVPLAATRARLAEDFDEGLDLIMQAADPMRQARELHQASRQFAESRPELARRCAETASFILLGMDAGDPQRLRAIAALYKPLAYSDRELLGEVLQQIYGEAAELGVDGADANLRMQLARALAWTDLDAALKLIEPIQDEELKQRNLYLLLDGALRSDPEKALELARQVREYRESRVRWAAGRLADEDPDLALDLLGLIEDPDERSSCLWGIVRGLATVDPRRALVLAGQVPRIELHESHLPTIVAHLATDDFEGALGVARRILDPRLRTTALANLCPQAPPERVPELIDEAMAIARQLTHSQFAQAAGYSPMDLAQLAWVARRYGYREYEELAWRALCESLSMTRNPDVYPDYPAETAQVLALTSPGAARQLLERRLATERSARPKYGLLGQVLTTQRGGATVTRGTAAPAFSAAAEADPLWAMELLKQLPPMVMEDGREFPNVYAVQCLVEVLVDDREMHELRVWHFLNGRDWLPVGGPPPADLGPMMGYL